jgi:hypothetical protein
VSESVLESLSAKEVKVKMGTCPSVIDAVLHKLNPRGSLPVPIGGDDVSVFEVGERNESIIVSFWYIGLFEIPILTRLEFRRFQLQAAVLSSE